MWGSGWEWNSFRILRIVVLLFMVGFLVAEGDVFLGFPCVEALIVSLPLDKAELSVCIREELLLIHLTWTTF